MRYRERERLTYIRHRPQQPGLAVILLENVFLRGREKREPMLRCTCVPL